MFGAAIIVFRETLEAALLIGIIAAATRTLPQRNRWILVGIGAGLLGSLVVAALAESISEMAGGSGSELFNAAILTVAVLMLGWHNVWMTKHGKEMAAQAKSVARSIQDGQRELSAIAVVIALAVLREGSETALFLYGLAAGGELNLGDALAGGMLGVIGGAGIGGAIYLGLLGIPVRWFFSFTGGLILLVAAGMAGQAARFLIQADFLPPMVSPLWDTSDVLPVSSPLGSVLHVLIGYEARPAATQVLVSLAALALILAGMRWARMRGAPPNTQTT